MDHKPSEQGVIGVSDAAVAHVQQVRESDKIPEAEIQSAIKDIWNAALLLLENFKSWKVNNNQKAKPEHLNKR